MMKAISLTQGKVALVDDEDFERLSANKWHARKSPVGIFYACRTSASVVGKQKSIQMSREILNAPPDVQVDHINGNGLDNRRVNVRLASNQENSRNKRKQANNTSSRFKGVSRCLDCKRWRAQIQIDGRKKYLGLFTDELTAAKAYDAAAREFFGAFAKLNFSV